MAETDKQKDNWRSSCSIQEKPWMKLSVQPKLKHNSVPLTRYTGNTNCEMHYMNAWLKRCVFNLDLNRERLSEPRMLSGRLFQSFLSQI